MKALEYLLSRPLMVTPEALDAALAVAQREHGRPTALEGREGRPVEDAELSVRRGSVTLISVVGPIHRYADMMTALCGGVTTAALAKEFTRAVDDPSCSAVVLSFDTPGGEVTGAFELADMIREGAGRKPVVAYAAGQCCSMGYLLASACSEIVADQAAELGSIGVRASVPVPTDDPKKPRWEAVSSQSPNKVTDPRTEKGRSLIQAHVDDLAEVFIGKVAENLGVTTEAVVRDFGAGGTTIGAKAVAAGMADRLGSLEGLITELNAAGRSYRTPRRERASARTPQAQKETEMNWTPRALKAWMAKGQPDNFDPEKDVPAGDAPPTPALSSSPPPPQTFDATEAPEFKAMRAKVAELEAANASAAADRIDAQASAFVQAEFHAGRILPAEAAGLKALYAQAAADDAARPLASGSRVESLKATHAARPKHALYREQLSAQALPADVLVLGQRGNPANPDAPPTPERTNELLAKFAAGRALLAAEKKSG